MAKKLSPRDPRAAHRRKSIATRLVGADAQCKCGENRPEALIPSSDPTICAACDRKARGKTDKDNHHIAGQNNSPVTINVPVNDHRAELSTAQHDWPTRTLKNPDQSPLRTGAAYLRGFADTIIYLIHKFILWVAGLLESLDTFLERKLGQRWWEHTNLKSFETYPS